MNDLNRSKVILKVEAIEGLVNTDEGMELNEGYRFEINGSIPEVADGIAKMAAEMDMEPTFGDNGGGAFVALIVQYYNALRGGGTA